MVFQPWRFEPPGKKTARQRKGVKYRTSSPPTATNGEWIEVLNVQFLSLLPRPVVCELRQTWKALFLFACTREAELNMLLYNQTVCCILLFIFGLQIFLLMFITIGFDLLSFSLMYTILCVWKLANTETQVKFFVSFVLPIFSKFCSKTKNSAGEMPATETRLSEILRQILSRTYTGCS